MMAFTIGTTTWQFVPPVWRNSPPVQVRAQRNLVTNTAGGGAFVQHLNRQPPRWTFDLFYDATQDVRDGTHWLENVPAAGELVDAAGETVRVARQAIPGLAAIEALEGEVVSWSWGGGVEWGDVLVDNVTITPTLMLDDERVLGDTRGEGGMAIAKATVAMRLVALATDWPEVQ